jgi:hypothetical protein
LWVDVDEHDLDRGAVGLVASALREHRSNSTLSPRGRFNFQGGWFF